MPCARVWNRRFTDTNWYALPCVSMQCFDPFWSTPPESRNEKMESTKRCFSTRIVFIKINSSTVRRCYVTLCHISFMACFREMVHKSFVFTTFCSQEFSRMILFLSMIMTNAWKRSYIWGNDKLNRRIDERFKDVHSMAKWTTLQWFWFSASK